MYIKKETKIRKIYNKFKELWSNKRYRSIIKLLFYFIFFVILFLILGSTPDETDYYQKKVKFADYVSYNFILNINVNDNIYSINGSRYYDMYQFSYGGENFKISFSDIIKSNLDKNIINSFNYDPNLISNIIKNSNLISEKKIISNNEIVKEYSITLTKYLNILDFNLTNYDDNDLILLNVTESDELVTKIELDLTNFYKNIEEHYFKYEISISYDKINSVSEF